ncbi:epoxide hydrolase 1 [Pendulispora rubella]|uniref:Epoxide hydrolase 1 n=1 Tax=Pendulispora rubella TaxID=2741070 RepID=A0ABZ2L774_9BACT
MNSENLLRDARGGILALFVVGLGCANHAIAKTPHETIVHDAAIPVRDTAIRPFHIHIPKEDLDDLHRRVQATRWPSRETVTDRSQGVQLAKVQELVHEWGDHYDWRKLEAKLNAWPQFMTTIDGVDVHFIHVRSRHSNALPVLITHGWPGSIVEQMGLIEPLTDPTAHGGRAEEAFDVILPSIPGFGFSGKPTGTGWDTEQIARAWAKLMGRIGYTRYVAQGGDWGAAITSAMARQRAPGLVGIHVNFPAILPANVFAILDKGEPAPPGLSDDEKATFDAVRDTFKKRFAYYTMMATHPQAVSYALTDSPVGLAGWIYDFNDAEAQRLLTKQQVLDDLTLYWLTNTASSSARLYWEDKAPALSSAAQKTTEIDLPVAVTVFPSEFYHAPKSWTQRAYPTLMYFNEAARGGHFAAWEEPELFSSELRAAFRSLR